MSQLDNILRWKLVSKSWVALHPNPCGIIQFIGGSFFGSFPTIFYRYFLNLLYDAGYTLIVFPFRFSFRHAPITIKLFKEQARVQQTVARIAKGAGYSDKVYQDPANYVWIGHSLGGKYVALLEVVAGKQAQQQARPSVLIAPVISNTDSAIPVPWVAQLIDSLGLGVAPTRERTQQLLTNSSLFKVTALVSFSDDTITGTATDRNKDKQAREKSDVLWFLEQLQHYSSPLLHQEIPGQHLNPLGLQLSESGLILNPWGQLKTSSQLKQLKEVTLQLLYQLKKGKFKLNYP